MLCTDGDPASAIIGRSLTHHLLVNTAIPKIAANIICPKHACSSGNQYCSNLRTTSPPSTAWTTTPPTAIAANQRSHRRSSISQIKIASPSSKIPRTPAITRCECSKNEPGFCISCFSDGNQVPNDFGQSGTESAAPFDVTSAPKTKSRTVQRNTNTAYRCNRGL